MSKDDFLNLVYKETILVGHSLENDLLALKISHNLVIDTAVLYTQPGGGSHKTALRVLTRRFLSREMQESERGNGSIEGPYFGSPPSFARKKLLSVLSECGKASTFIDNISIGKRYESELSNAIPVSLDDEALLKATKEFLFSELNSYFTKQAEDMERLNGKLAEMISLVTCDKNSTQSKGIKYSVSTELKDILSRLNARIKRLYYILPTNAILVICTDHGKTAIVRRLRKMLREQNDTELCREKLVKVLEELQAGTS
ncbi:polynucleotidyl transferase, ribonuclease H-like superfamily protein [Actinidia rufa]|uniref:Polynucleotidyl transferase, ribonuclease H-like superfamily protein n=1 Tax=Actinidia rufa TaxID=165716 RepID=A0A7J0DL53_9ERIC|nr:polynucleotidyl transferase, ribonuclease H-like superfamily protein [Actinidia rufa]